MNEVVAQKLNQLLVKYGWETLSKDPRRVEDLLSDSCPDCQTEVRVLVAVLEARAADDMLKADPAESKSELLARLTSRIVRQCALPEASAGWGVSTWAQALGVTLPTATEPAAPSSHDTPEDGDSYIKRGDTLMEQGNKELARKMFEQGLSILLQTARSDAANTQLRTALAEAYEKLAKVSEKELAIKALAQSLKIREALVLSDPNDGEKQWLLSSVLRALAKLRRYQSEQQNQSPTGLPAAVAMIRQALGICETLANSQPDNPRWQAGLADALEDVAYFGDTKPGEKAGLLGREVEILKRLVMSSQDDVLLRRRLAQCYGSLGGAVEDHQQKQRAFERELDLTEGLLALDPANDSLATEVCIASRDLERVFDLQSPEEISEDRKVALAERLAQSWPACVRIQLNLIGRLGRAGLALSTSRPKEAEALWLRGRNLWEQLIESKSRDVANVHIPGTPVSLPDCYLLASMYLCFKGKRPQALQMELQLIARIQGVLSAGGPADYFSRLLAKAYGGVGHLWVGLDDRGQAQKALEKKLELDKRFDTEEVPNDLLDLGEVAGDRLTKQNEALNYWKRAIAASVDRLSLEPGNVNLIDTALKAYVRLSGDKKHRAEYAARYGPKIREMLQTLQAVEPNTDVAGIRQILVDCNML